jgi:hypothetical protein
MRQSAKVGDERHQAIKELRGSSSGASSAQPVGGVVRDSESSAQPVGGVVRDSETWPPTVLRVFLKSGQGADAHHRSTNELRGSSGGALDTATVVRVFLERQQAAI